MWKWNELKIKFGITMLWASRFFISSFCQIYYSWMIMNGSNNVQIRLTVMSIYLPSKYVQNDSKKNS